MRKQARLGAAWVIVAAALAACKGGGDAGSPSDGSGGADSSGGAAGAAGSGGESDATGGQDGSGGDADTGGSDSGGSGNTGGSNTGGAVSTGGVSSGGTDTGGTSSGGASSGGTESTGGTSSGGTDTGGTSSGGTASVEGNVIFREPETLVGDEGGEQLPLPAPNGDLEIYGITPGGRLIVAEPSSKEGMKSIVSMLPNGTDRIVLVDAATLSADAQSVYPLALTVNDYVFYVVFHASTSSNGAPDIYLGSVSSTGSTGGAPIQLSGGTTGVTNVAFWASVPPSGTRGYYTFMHRLFTTNGALVFTEANGSDDLRIRAITPDLNVTTAVTVTYNYRQTACGVTPSGRLIYYKSRSPGGSLWDVFAVNLDGTNEVRLNTDDFNVYNCQVTQAGTVLVSKMEGQYNQDIYAWNGATLVPVATSADSETFNGETADGRLVYEARDVDNSHVSVHVVEPDGENMVTLSGKDDSFGPFGSLLALTEDRAIFIRSASYGDMGTVHSALLDGTSRLQLLPENKIRSWDPFGVSSNGRLVYRMEGNGTPSTVRLYSMRVDSVISPGVPDQVILSHDPTSQLTFLLP